MMATFDRHPVLYLLCWTIADRKPTMMKLLHFILGNPNDLVLVSFELSER